MAPFFFNLYHSRPCKKKTERKILVNFAGFKNKNNVCIHYSQTI
jgi:hypothetical protein